MQKQGKYFSRQIPNNFYLICSFSTTWLILVFVIWWAIKYTCVSHALKICSICIFFVTADNWIRDLPVIIASESIRYLWNNFNWCFSLGTVHSIYVYFFLLSWLLNTLQIYSCEQPSLIKNCQSLLWDVSWHFSVFFSSEAFVTTDNETLKWRKWRQCR